jgi:hypothetical protein
MLVRLRPSDGSTITGCGLTWFDYRSSSSFYPRPDETEIVLCLSASFSILNVIGAIYDVNGNEMEQGGYQ